MIRRILGQTLLTAVLFAGIFCLTAHAQLNNGTIRGTVTDSNGAVLPNANVTLTRLGTEEHFATVSNKTGGYTFTALSPGDYEVEVTATGFASQKGKLTLRVAQEAVIDEKLKVGAANASVTVQGDVTPIIDTADATLSDVKEAARLETLPVQSSNFLSVLNWTPGVVAGGYGGQGSGAAASAAVGGGGAFTRINGIEGGSVTYLVDGQTVNDRFTNELQATPQALQTIQELKITTSNGSAEYGTPGVVDIVSKGGTNEFHGQAHELYQSNTFEANQPFSTLPPHHVRNEFGGQLGGPVWIPKFYNGKNKTFFYFDAEGQIDHTVSVDHELLPNAAWQAGNFSTLVDVNANEMNGSGGGGDLTGIYDPSTTTYNAGLQQYVRTRFANETITNVDSISANILAAFYPKPNATSQGCVAGNCPTLGATNIWQYGWNWLDPAVGIDDIRRYVGKVDQILGAGLLSARYTYTYEKIQSADYGDFSGVVGEHETHYSRGHNGVLSYTRPVGTHAVNEARLGIQLFNQIGSPDPLNGAWAGVGMPVYPGLVGLGGVDLYDFEGVGNGGAWANLDRNNPKEQPNQSITLADNFSYTIGKHELKAGFSINNTRVTTIEDQNPGGNTIFGGNFTGLQLAGSQATGTGTDNAQDTTDAGSSLADFLVGEVSENFFELTPVFHTRQTDYSGFVTDNWKISPKLTLNIGLRYEYWSPYEDSSNLSSNLTLNGTNGVCSSAALTALGGTSCAPTGSYANATWFGQSQPTVVLPSGAQPAIYAATLAGYEALGLPVETAAQAGFPSHLWNMPKNNLVPRLGFAYSINPKTTIRGGYGIYQWTIPLSQYQANSRDNAPWQSTIFEATNQIYENTAELSFPVGPATVSHGSGNPAIDEEPGAYVTPNGNANNPASPRAIGTNFLAPLLATSQNGTLGSGFAVTVLDKDYKAQTAQEWNLTLERILPGDWGLSLGYVGNHGSNLPVYEQINGLLPRIYVPGNGTAAYLRRPYPIYATSNQTAMDQFHWNAYSNHEEGRIELKHTFRGSFIVQSYGTFGKTLTTSEAGYKSAAALEIPSVEITDNAQTYRERLGSIYAHDTYLSNYTFGANAHYELPFGKGKKYLSGSNVVVNDAVSGWVFAMFYIWHSGLQIAPYYSVTGSGTIFSPGAIHPHGRLSKEARNRNEWFDGSVYDPNNAAGLPFAGQTFTLRDTAADLAGPTNTTDLLNNIPRNYLTGPGFWNADGTVQKITPITKYAKLDIEMQCFNVFNHNAYGTPGNNGVISKSFDQTRLLQFQGKIIF